MTRRTCSRCGGRGLVETFGELDECAACDGTGEPRATIELDDLEASELGDRFHGVDRARLVRFLERGE